MKRSFLFLLGLVFGLMIGACGAAPAPRTPATPAAVEVPASHVTTARALEAKTVALVSVSKEGVIRAYCSGVWVSPSAILTANHCVDDITPKDVVGYVVRADVIAGDFTVRQSITVHGAQLLGQDVYHDLTLLRALAPPAHDIALLSVESIVQGLPVQAMGQPLGMWWSYSSGEIAAVRVMPNAMDNDMLLIQATVPISGGSSGGGLFDEYGMLVGITHASFTDGQNMNIFIHRTYLSDLLDLARKVGAL